MRYLLDTQAFIWFENGDNKLSKPIQKILSSHDNEKIVSYVSLWEIVIKNSLDKLLIKSSIDALLEAPGYTYLNINTSHLQALRTLPLHHRDPFDRLLIAQAISEGLELISSDKVFDIYGVKRSF